MCGIAGYALREGLASRTLVESMCDLIRHRGPDDEGYYVEGPCALGMRRLSIIDLSTGHQPITNEDRSMWIVFNGEIYNYQTLAADLAAKGHRFTTRSDTETVLHLYEQEDTNRFDRLRGMFAIALWDAHRRQLVLVRDRFGKKPLYYAAQPEGLFFASELKCLRQAGVPLELDTQALQLYFQFGYIPDPWTPYRAIRKIAPGSWLRYHASDGRIEQDHYWQLPPPAERPPAESREDLHRQLRDCFDESVRLRLIADVPLGAFLSGGIDSGLVVASMARQSSAPVKTFSIGFAEPGYNELPLARRVSGLYRTEHHELIVDPDAASLIEHLVGHFDEPFGDASAIPTFLVSRFAAQHVKVALTGDGGDEIFGGYWSLMDSPRLERFARLPGFVHSLAAAGARTLPYSAYGKNFLNLLARRSPLGAYFESTYTPSALRHELFHPEWNLPEHEDALPRLLSHCLLPDSHAALSRQITYFEAKANLAGDMLVKIDRMSMANSLEVRCPMLDHEVAAFGMRLPFSFNVRKGRGKRFLADAFADRLPREIFDRPKRGFSCPLALWFRGSLRPFLHDHLHSRSFRERGIVSQRFVDHLIGEHERGRRDNYPVLWMLLVLELWLREFSSAKPAPEPAQAVT